MKTQRRAILIFTLLSLFVLIFNQCFKEEKVAQDARGAEYAGSQKCIACHSEVYNSYAQTAHQQTSNAASRQTIRGSFANDSNVFEYRPELKVVMEQHDSGFYQVAYLNNVKRKSVRFDIVTGSGRKGQSYLYWYNDNIYQLPVSYYAPGNSWVNSPNFPPHNVQFTRNIPIGCFECHASYIRKTDTKPVNGYLVDYFEKEKIIYGIDCERCHGAAAAHVNFQEKHPLEKQAKFITNIARLDRQQKLDMCSICHSGARETITSTLLFKPGDNIANYLSPDTVAPDIQQVDVHGKQYQLLTESKCFLKSADLTCNSCHNVHRQERNDMKAFSSKCRSCHGASNHDALSLSKAARAFLVNNCIDCHMPAKPSAVITMQLPREGKVVPALVRTHYISIYADATENFLQRK